MIRAVLFDLDGTLYSSAPILGEAYRIVIEERNAASSSSIPVPDTEEILRLVGRPVREIFKGLFPALDEAEREDLSARVLVQLTRMIRAGGGRLMEGVKETIERLKDGGARVGVVSNSRRAYLDAVTERFGIMPLLERATCDEDADWDKAGQIAAALAEWNITPNEAAMVGDRSSDIEAARKVGCLAVGCAFGHAGDEEIGSADIVISSLGELPDRLAGLSREAISRALIYSES